MCRWWRSVTSRDRVIGASVARPLPSVSKKKESTGWLRLFFFVFIFSVFFPLSYLAFNLVSVCVKWVFWTTHWNAMGGWVEKTRAAPLDSPLNSEQNALFRISTFPFAPVSVCVWLRYQTVVSRVHAFLMRQASIKRLQSEFKWQKLKLQLEGPRDVVWWELQDRWRDENGTVTLAKKIWTNRTFQNFNIAISARFGETIWGTKVAYDFTSGYRMCSMVYHTTQRKSCNLKLVQGRFCSGKLSEMEIRGMR